MKKKSTIKTELEREVNHPGFTYGTVTRACFRLASWLDDTKKSISANRLRKMMIGLGYSEIDFSDTWKLLKREGWIVPTIGSGRKWWVLCKKGQQEYRLWLKQAKSNIKEHISTLHNEVMKDYEYHSFAVPDWKKFKILSKGHDLLLHYDQGEKERLEYFLNNKPLSRNTYTSIWTEEDIELGIDQNEDFERYLDESTLNEVFYLKISLDEIKSTIIYMHHSIEEAMSKMIEDPLPFLRKKEQKEQLKKITDYPREELWILISAMPRSLLFQYYLLLNLYHKPPYVQRYFYTQAEEYLYNNGVVGPPLIIESPQPPLSTVKTGLFFLESESIRFDSKSFKKFSDSCEKLIICYPSPSDNFPYKGIETYQKTESMMKEKYPKIKENINISYQNANNVVNMLDKLKPNTIFISGNRVTALGAIKYYVDKLNSYSNIPNLYFVHVAASKYSKGYTPQIHEVLRIDSYSVDTSYH